MKSAIFFLFTFSLCLVGMSFEASNTFSTKEVVETEEKPSSEKPFDVMMKVLTHQRCVNCHPSGDRPRQGDERRVHNFNIQRGVTGHGMTNAKCSTCHQAENNNYSGVPGAPHWHLAPKSMAWEGLNRVEIAQSILDTSKNGGRSIEEIEKHLLEDPLVLWAFDPGLTNEGVPREKPPVSKEVYFEAVKQWVADGAVIPEN